MKLAALRKHPFASLLASIFLSLHADAVMAQAYPCPQGPGAGQQQVGVSGGSHGVAAVPMCVNTSAGGAVAYQNGPAPIHAAHWVLAIGVGRDGRSAYVLAADPVFAEDAEALVFRRCKVTGIRDCQVVRRFDAGVFALAEAADGGFVHALYPYPQSTSEIRQAKKALKLAEKAIMDACVQQTGGSCTVKEIRPSNEWSGYDQ
ncbi:MAG TPA: DUF4189 domain-containing protein [Xanthomonadaceae bacterium]